MMDSWDRKDAWPSLPQVFEKDIVLDSVDLDRKPSAGRQDSHTRHAPVISDVSKNQR